MFFFFQAEDGIRDSPVTGVQTCALPILTKDLERGGYRPGQFINLPYFNKTERRALNIDGTEFTFEQFIPLVESNLVDPDQLNIITESIDKKIFEGADEDFKDGPPCLPTLSTIMKDPQFDGKDRFMYNYHVFVKMKYYIYIFFIF